MGRRDRSSRRAASRAIRRGIANMVSPMIRVLTSGEWHMATAKKLPTYRLFSDPWSHQRSPWSMPHCRSSVVLYGTDQAIYR